MILKNSLPLSGGAKRRLVYFYECKQCHKTRETINKRKADYRVKGGQLCGVCKRHQIDENQLSLIN